MGVLGVLIYQLLLRWNQGQELRQALITIAVIIIAGDQMLAHFGGVAKDIKLPASWPTSVDIPLIGSFGFFRLTIVLGSAILVGLLLWWMIKRTRFGLITRAGVDDQRCIHLFDDGRPLELRSRREKITAIDVSFNPLAVEIDLAPSSTRLVYVGRDLWAEQRQIDTLTHSNDGRTDVHQHR